MFLQKIDSNFFSTHHTELSTVESDYQETSNMSLPQSIPQISVADTSRREVTNDTLDSGMDTVESSAQVTLPTPTLNSSSSPGPSTSRGSDARERLQQRLQKLSADNNRKCDEQA